MSFSAGYTLSMRGKTPKNLLLFAKLRKWQKFLSHPFCNKIIIYFIFVPLNGPKTLATAAIAATSNNASEADSLLNR